MERGSNTYTLVLSKFPELPLHVEQQIYSEGFAELVQVNIERLDMTACNISPPGALVVGQALGQLPSTAPLQSFCLGRNFYMGRGSNQLITAASRRLLRLDIIYQLMPFGILSDDSVLQHYLMLQGHILPIRD